MLLVSGLNVCSFSQNGVTSFASAGATIIAPVKITKTAEIDLGIEAVVLSLTVEMIPSEINMKKGDKPLPVSLGTFTAASFNVRSGSGYTYSITLPSEPLIVDNGKSVMTVTSFTSDPTLGVGKGLIAGVYVMVSPTDVTVNYD